MRFLFIFLFFLLPLEFFSQKIYIDGKISEIEQNDSSKLLIGLKMSPPFTMKNEDGRFSGISIELWEAIARDLGVKFRYIEYDLKGLLEAVENGEIDLCISPLTVTSERLKKFDFTQPFYTSSIGIAIKGKQKSFAILLISNIFTLNFLKAVFALLSTIFVLGFFLWLAERKVNPNFANGVKGMGDGIWWSAVTMATVGYGDKVPVTPLGRAIAVFWMFLSLIIISSLTASITTALTMDRMSTNIEHLNDLAKLKSASVEGSSTQAFLQKRGIKVHPLKTIEEGLRLLENGKIDAFVYDKPILNYLIQQNYLSDKLKIIEQDLNLQYYSFSLPRNSKLLNEINPLLIKELESTEWKRILSQYNLSQE